MLYVDSVTDSKIGVKDMETNAVTEYPVFDLTRLKKSGVAGIFSRSNGELFAVPMTVCGSGIVKYLGTLTAPSEYQGVVRREYPSRSQEVGSLSEFVGVCLGSSGSLINFNTPHIDINGSWIVRADTVFSTDKINCLLVSSTTDSDARLPYELAARVPNINAYLDDWLRKQGYAINSVEGNYNPALNMVTVPKRLFNNFYLTLPKSVFLDKVDAFALERLRHYSGKVVMQYSDNDLNLTGLDNVSVFGALRLKECAGEYLLSCETVSSSYGGFRINSVPLTDILSGLRTKVEVKVDTNQRRYFPDVEIQGNNLVLTCMQGTIVFDIDALTQDNMAGVSDARAALNSTRNLLFKDVGVSYDVTNNGVLRHLKVVKKDGGDFKLTDVITIPKEVRYIDKESVVDLSAIGYSSRCTIIVPDTLESVPGVRKNDRYSRFGDRTWHSMTSKAGILILDTDRPNIILPFALKTFSCTSDFKDKQKRFGCTEKGDLPTMLARLWLTFESSFDMYPSYGRTSHLVSPAMVASSAYGLFNDKFDMQEDVRLDTFCKRHSELKDAVTFLSSISDILLEFKDQKPLGVGSLSVPRDIGVASERRSRVGWDHLGLRVTQRTDTTLFLARYTNIYGAYARDLCFLYPVLYLAEAFGVYDEVLDICRNPAGYKLDDKAKISVKLINKVIAHELSLSKRIMDFGRGQSVPAYSHRSPILGWMHLLLESAYPFPEWSK